MDCKNFFLRNFHPGSEAGQAAVTSCLKPKPHRGVERESRDPAEPFAGNDDRNHAKSWIAKGEISK